MNNLKGNEKLVTVSNDHPKWQDKKLYDAHIINHNYADDECALVALDKEQYEYALSNPEYLNPLTEKELDDWCK